MSDADIGTWKCKAMFWDSWSEANLDVAMFEADSAEVGFHIFFGDVEIDVGKCLCLGLVVSSLNMVQTSESIANHQKNTDYLGTSSLIQ